MIKIKKENLKVKRCFDDGSPKLYSADLRQLDLPRKDLDKIQSILNKLRTLSEISINLIAAIDIVTELESDNSRGFGTASFSNKNEALFSMAATLYCACFQLDHKKRIPIRVLNESDFLKLPSIHYEIKDFRDKRLCHLDKDHKVRSNRVNWLFHVKDDNCLKASGADYISELSIFFLGEKNQEWIDHMGDLLNKIIIKQKELESEMNKLLPDLSVDDTTDN